MASETFQLLFTYRGAKETEAAINSMGTAAQKTTNIMKFFRNALVALSAVRAAQSVVEFADASTRITNRLRVSTKSVEEFTRAQRFVSIVSRETRTDLEANAVTYSRLLRSTEGLGFKTEQLESAMRSLAFSVKVGGATSQEARNALIQFSQALASGALRGDELRSVAEQLPALANAIGKEFGKSGGELIAFAKANPGILETEKVLRGVIRAEQDLARQAALITPTLTEGFIVIKNAIIEMLTEVQSGTNLFGILTKAMVFLADNIKIVTIAIIGFSTALIGSFVAQWASSILTANAALIRYVTTLRLATAAQYLWNAALAANPIGVIIAAIIALGAAFLYAYNNIPGVAEAVNYVWQQFTQLVTYLINQFQPTWQALVMAFNALTPALQAIWQLMVEGWTIIGSMVARFIEATGGVQGWANALTMFLIPGLKVLLTLLPFIISAGLLPLVGAFDLVVQALYSFNLVSAETYHNVRVGADGFYKYVDALIAVGPSALATEEGQKKLSEALGKTGTESGKVEQSTSNLSNNVLPALDQSTSNVAKSTEKMFKYFGQTATASEKTATSVGVLSTNTGALGENTGTTSGRIEGMNMNIAKTPEAVDPAVEAMADLTAQVKKAAEAYRELAKAKSGAGLGGGDGASVPNNFAGAFATGGRIPAGQFGLVGEYGPEFVEGPATVTPINSSSISALDTSRKFTSSDVSQIAGDFQKGYGEISNIGEARGFARALAIELQRARFEAIFSPSGGGGGTGMTASTSVTPYGKPSEATLALIKQSEEATMAFKEFKNSIPGLMANPPVIDFQTLTPFQGGKNYGFHDPYGITSMANQKEAMMNPYNGTGNMGGGTFENDNRITVQMTVNTPDAASFRQNRAQIEDAVYSAVERARRRRNR